MAHEITESDTVGIVGSTGWHGLGKNIEAGQSALQAMETVGLDWTVTEETIQTATDSRDINSHKALRRSDNQDVLNVVGINYSVVQPKTLAAIADSLAGGDNSPSVDTIGSLRGGRNIFIGLRGEDTVIGGDETYQYLLLANGYGDGRPLRIHPTCTRVVCANTFGGSTADAHLGYTWRHTAGLSLRVEEVQDALRQWRDRLRIIKSEGDTLAALDVNSERVSAIMVAVYEATTGIKIPTNPTTPVEQRRLIRATDAISYMQKVFDTERSQGSKPSVWLAANSTTNWIQHVHGRLDGEDRAASCVLGAKAVDTARAMRIALTVGTA